MKGYLYQKSRVSILIYVFQTKQFLFYSPTISTVIVCIPKFYNLKAIERFSKICLYLIFTVILDKLMYV